MIHKKLTILLALVIAVAHAWPAVDPQRESDSPEEMDDGSLEELSDEIDSGIREIWEELMGKVQNVTFRVMNVPATETFIKSVCGPSSCIYGIVDMYNLTLPILLPVVPDNSTFTLNFNDTTMLTPRNSSAATPMEV